MARIFLALAIFAMALLAANLVIGLSIGDLNDVSHRLVEARRDQRDPRGDKLGTADAVDAALREYRPMRERYRWHILCGLAAALVTVLVNSISVTYFIGTSRWCKEVVETYRLPEELVSRSLYLKRRAFPWAILGIATILAIAALGAASDPGANFESGRRFVVPHYLMAYFGLVLIGGAFWMQFLRIAGNYAVIEEILDHVRRIQDERQSSATT